MTAKLRNVLSMKKGLKNLFSIRVSFFLIAILYATSFNNPLFAQDNLKNTVLFMRHALAPGFGDPDNFILGDCSTQRNLDEQGKSQAKQIGQKLKNMGVTPTSVYSSQWCRCLDTARLINFGEVKPHIGLNSFFQRYADKKQTLDNLSKLIKSLERNNGPYVFVTHQVVITETTGIYPASGDIVAYDIDTGKSRPFPLKD